MSISRVRLKSGIADFVMLVGIPASGKSTLSRDFRDSGYTVLSSDEIRLGLSCESSEQRLDKAAHNALNRRVFESIFAQARAALENGDSVVVDATNLSRKRRRAFLQGLVGIRCTKRCFLFIASPEVCKSRNSARNELTRVPDEEMQRMLCSFEAPSYAEGWDEILPVADGEPYSFPFSAARDFCQDNPHHNLTLLEHLSAARDYARAAGYSDELTRVAFYHDIGKLYTKTFINYKGEPDTVAHFYGHENYGAYLYLCEGLCGRGLAADDFRSLLYEAGLINFHMRPLTAWRDSSAALRRDRELFGDRFIDDVIALNKADCAAHKE